MGFGNMQKIMQQAKKMQQDMLKKQDELKEKTIEVTSGGGAVKVVIALDLSVKSVTIDKDVVDPDDVELLENLVLAAMRESIEKAKSIQEKEMSSVTGGLGLPGM
ncbi:MAG: YbaB/EbfC family nucleoid-associated protein [Erysipelotrichaceae bacterium]|nr:YbaB/EbfC family nucleoid-associated protein [Erysipelotrichaceae bacterium]